MGCRHLASAASRDVRDSASSLEAGQLSAHAGSPDSKRPPREDTVDDASKEAMRNESFAAKASAKDSCASALNGTHTRQTARFSRGTPVVPITDDSVDSVACLSTDRRRTATDARASDDSNHSTSLESGTKRFSTRERRSRPPDEAFLDSANDTSEEESLLGSENDELYDGSGSIDRHDRSETDATSVLFMSTFDGTGMVKNESPDESPDALLRVARALLNRSAPCRFGAESRFPRESNTGADDAATGDERIDTREKRGSARVPVLEAYDEAHARRKKTRGGEPSIDALDRARLAFSIPNDARVVDTSRRVDMSRESVETKAQQKQTKPSPRARVPSADGAKGAQGAQGARVARPPFRDVRRFSAEKTDFAKKKAASPSPTRGALAAPFERVRRRSAERAARASRSGTSSVSPCHESHESHAAASKASKTLLDDATRRRLAEATATLARVEASRREKFSAAHPARASSSHGQTVSASADRARRLGDVLAEYRSVRGSSTIETARMSDTHSRTEPRGGELFDENAENAESYASLSSRARFFAGTSKTSIATSLDTNRHEKHTMPHTMPFASPTVRATPLTSGAPKRTVAPMSEKMRRARGALRALQIPGAEPAAPRRARVAAQAERVSSAATFVTTQRVSASSSAAACAARPASHLVGHRERNGYI